MHFAGGGFCERIDDFYLSRYFVRFEVRPGERQQVRRLHRRVGLEYHSRSNELSTLGIGRAVNGHLDDVRVLRDNLLDLGRVYHHPAGEYYLVGPACMIEEPVLVHPSGLRYGTSRLE